MITLLHEETANLKKLKRRRMMKKAMVFVVGLVFLFSTSAFAVEPAVAPVKEEAVKAEAAKPEAAKKEVKKAAPKKVKKTKKAPKKAAKPAEEKAAPAPEAAPAVK